MHGARVESKTSRLMKKAHKILKEWIFEPQSTKYQLKRIPVIIRNR